jgi:hypothetical protein
MTDTQCNCNTDAIKAAFVPITRSLLAIQGRLDLLTTTLADIVPVFETSIAKQCENARTLAHIVETIGTMPMAELADIASGDACTTYDDLVDEEEVAFDEDGSVYEDDDDEDEESLGGFIAPDDESDEEDASCDAAPRRSRGTSRSSHPREAPLRDASHAAAERARAHRAAAVREASRTGAASHTVKRSRVIHDDDDE